MVWIIFLIKRFKMCVLSQREQIVCQFSFVYLSSEKVRFLGGTCMWH
jgi:hypothetical protein